jgi:tetratricopeptide (TPR) repeat protein
VDLTTMTIQEQAQILFNRVMGSSSAGDTADVAFFLPKALVIHEELNPTDPDGLYHYALLHQVGGSFQASLEKAQEGLAEIPNYLLLLAVAAEASIGLGDEEAARGFYTHFLEVYEEEMALVDVFDAEMALVRPGYEHHMQIFPAYRAQAEVYLGGG